MKRSKKIQGTSFEDVLVEIQNKLKEQKKMTPEQLKKQQEETQKILKELGPSGPICITFSEGE